MLRADHLHKSYHGTEVVRDVDFEVREGSIVGLVGANGAGKSTTIKMLAGLVEPTRGAALLAGRPTLEPEVRHDLGYLPEDSPLYEDLDPRALLTFFGALYGLGRKESWRRGEDLLDRLGLDQRHWSKPVGQMSKGMRRKVAIARTLLHDPAVLLLDEPGSGLDPPTIQELGEFFLELRDAGKAVLLSAHNLPQVEELCDHILIVHDGQVPARGTLAELREAWGDRRYRVRATVALPGGEPHGSVFEAQYADWGEVESALAGVHERGGTVLEVEAIPPSLDQILVKATGK